MIGVPLPGSELRGLDSLYAIVQMPAGVPVACMAVGSHGARNAALFAVQILSLQDERLRDAFAEYKANLARPRS